MEGNGTRAIPKGVVLYERDLGERRDRFHALRFVLNCALNQQHRNALWRALGEVRHESFRRLALPHGLGDGEVERRGDAPWIACSAWRSRDEARSFSRIVPELRLRAL